jgi:hypothetical protein
MLFEIRRNLSSYCIARSSNPQASQANNLPVGEQVQSSLGPDEVHHLIAVLLIHPVLAEEHDGFQI